MDLHFGLCLTESELKNEMYLSPSGKGPSSSYVATSRVLASGASGGPFNAANVRGVADMVWR